MWFRLNRKAKDGSLIEYSTDFNFFLENQIFVSKSGAKYSFNSRLESFTFLTKTAILRTANDYNFSETEINELCKSIHYNLINGNYGEGEIIS